MATTQPVVVGVFTERGQADRAIDELLNSGFSNDQIRFSGHEAGTSDEGFLGKIKSVFTGEGTTGGAHDELVDLGVPDEDARYYQREYDGGRYIVAVLADGRMEDATNILARNGGYGTGRRTAETGYATTTDTGTPGYTATTAGTETEGEQNLKLREEQLRVQKQPVESGEARLRKDVVTEQKNVDVPVSREEVYVERRPGSGQPADQPIGEKEETYRVPVREEQVNVTKQPVETGEVAIGKRQVQETQPVSDTVRREEAHLERQGDVDVQGANMEDTDTQRQ
jgi:uncharacterized protein (TIGR02271 family)